jgi:hypothetical protein
MNQFVFAAIALPTLALIALAINVTIIAHKNKVHRRRWLNRAKATRSYKEQVYCRNIAYRGAL